MIDASVTNATAIACHTEVTNPKPAVPNIPSAHARYIAVTGFRGSVPRWPNTAAAITAPTPPAPKTRPSEDPSPPRVVLHHERDERLPRSPDGEQAHGRADHRDQQPPLAPHVPEPFDDVPEEGALLLLIDRAARTAPHRQDHHGGERERRRVREEREPDPEPRDQEAAHQWTDERHRERPDELRQGVGLHEQVRRHDRGRDRAERRLEHGLPGAVDDDEPDHDRDRRADP